LGIQIKHCLAGVRHGESEYMLDQTQKNSNPFGVGENKKRKK